MDIVFDIKLSGTAEYMFRLMMRRNFFYFIKHKEVCIVSEQIMEIVNRLHMLREIMDVSVEDVAAACGISVEEYMAYESGKNDLSFSFLYKVAGVLGVDVIELLSGDSAKLNTCTLVRRGGGFPVKRREDYDYKHLAYTFRGHKVDPLMVSLSPTEDEPHLNTHEGQEFNLVCEGRMLFKLGDMQYEMDTGDTVYFNSGIPHYMKALDGRPAKFLAIVIK